jgi:hypothetical protein
VASAPPERFDASALLRASAAPAPASAVEAPPVAAPVRGERRGLGTPARAGLVALAAACALLTLQRNDLLGSSARGLFGAPSPETPSGVRAFLSSMPPLASPEALKPKPLPPRPAEPRLEAEPHAPQARAAGTTKTSGAKSKKSKAGKAKPTRGK